MARLTERLNQDSVIEVPYLDERRARPRRPGGGQPLPVRARARAQGDAGASASSAVSRRRPSSPRRRRRSSRSPRLARVRLASSGRRGSSESGCAGRLGARAAAPRSGGGSGAPRAPLGRSRGLVVGAVAAVGAKDLVGDRARSAGRCPTIASRSSARRSASRSRTSASGESTPLVARNPRRRRRASPAARA